MTLYDKLQILRRMQDLVLFKWVCGQKRVASNFIMLSDLRLNTLTCHAGRVVFSSAAPILFMEKGRPVIQFRDSDIMTVLNGTRKGINILSRVLQPVEEASACRYCDWREIVDSSYCPKWLEDKIMSMGNSPTYPVSKVIMPELFRISKKPETLKPIFSSSFIEDIGGSKTDSIQELLQKFYNNLDLFGYHTDEGYVISNDYIATGGCCVAASKGINARTGSSVHMMTLRAFAADVARRHWSIQLARQNKQSGGNNERDMERPDTVRSTR